MRATVGDWLVTLIRRTLDVAIGAPGSLVILAPLVLKAIHQSFGMLLRFEIGLVVIPVLTHCGRSFFRGLWAIVGLSLVLAAGLRAMVEAIGPLIEPIAEQAVVRILVNDAMPLIIALFIALRSVGALAAKLGQRPAIEGLDAGRYSVEDIRRLVLPNLAAAPVIAAAFYLLLILITANGARAIGPLPGSITAAWTWSPAGAWEVSPWQGALKSALFGLLLMYSGASVGVKVAREYRPGSPETMDLYRAVWESSVLGLLLCMVTLLFWTVT